MRCCSAWWRGAVPAAASEEGGAGQRSPLQQPRATNLDAADIGVCALLCSLLPGPSACHLFPSRLLLFLLLNGMQLHLAPLRRRRAVCSLTVEPPPRHQLALATAAFHLLEHCNALLVQRHVHPLIRRLQNQSDAMRLSSTAAGARRRRRLNAKPSGQSMCTVLLPIGLQALLARLQLLAGIPRHVCARCGRPTGRVPHHEAPARAAAALRGAGRQQRNAAGRRGAGAAAVVAAARARVLYCAGRHGCPRG